MVTGEPPSPLFFSGHFYALRFSLPIRRPADKALPDTRPMKGCKEVANIFLSDHLLVAPAAPQDVIHLKDDVPTDLIDKRPGQNSELGIVIILVLPAPGLPIEEH